MPPRFSIRFGPSVSPSRAIGGPTAFSGRVEGLSGEISPRISEDAGFAYLATHRENIIVRQPLELGGDGGRVIAGDPFTDQLVGPSSLAWGRGPGEYGRVAYVTTDGGHTMPPPGQPVRPAKLVRIEIPEAAEKAKKSG